MNAYGQMLQPAPIIPILIMLIFVTIVGQINPNIESYGIIGFIVLLVSAIIVGFGIPSLYIIIFKKDDKK